MSVVIILKLLLFKLKWVYHEFVGERLNVFAWVILSLLLKCIWKTNLTKHTMFVLYIDIEEIHYIFNISSE
jgi:hypothetical protein